MSDKNTREGVIAMHDSLSGNLGKLKELLLQTASSAETAIQHRDMHAASLHIRTLESGIKQIFEILDSLTNEQKKTSLLLVGTDGLKNKKI